MATDESNRSYRKRKSGVDIIFEVNENDCSPSSSPEPTENSIPENQDPQNKTEDKETIKIEEPNLTNNVYTEVQEVNIISETNKVIILTKEEKPEEEMIPEEPKVEMIPEEKQIILDKQKPAKKLLFTIKFSDKEFSEIHESRLIDGLMALFNYNIKEEVNRNELEIKFWEDKSSSDMEISDGEISDPPIQTESDILANLFVVDTTPAADAKLDIQPIFTQKYDEINGLGKTETENKSCAGFKSICFNCNGQHSLKDCKEPKDQRRIQMARNNFKNTYKNTRYHLDEEQKYGHIIPGKISENLRLALNLGKYEIPSYVYHMRRVGYSPGWLEMAKVTSSNMEIIDFDGSSVTNDVLERIDPKKVIEYSGFNMPLEKGVKDKHREYNCPPYNVNHSKECMLMHIENNYLCEKKRREEERKAKMAYDKINSKNVQTERQVENKVEDIKSREGSPTLNDLEIQKRHILELLEEGKITETLETSTTQEDSTINENLNNSIKSSTFGTPLLKNCSPFQRLPNCENFSKDISQVINFENLPNATGKYEQMSEVINKVRKVIKYTGESKS